MTTLSNRGKTYTSGQSIRRQDDTVFSAKPYSVWQGYVLVGILIAIAYVLVAHILPYLH